MFDILDMGASGLTAQRTRMDTVANNLLNINSTKGGPDGNEPFRRRIVTFSQGAAPGSDKPGVHVSEITLDQSPFTERFEPWNPDCDAKGNVRYPNVDMTVETVNMLEASRAYEATVTMMETAKAMFNASLRLIA